MHNFCYAPCNVPLPSASYVWLLMINFLFQIKWMWCSQRGMHTNICAIPVPGDSIRACYSYRPRLCAGWKWLCLQTKICSHWWIWTKCNFCHTTHIIKQHIGNTVWKSTVYFILISKTLLWGLQCYWTLIFGVLMLYTAWHPHKNKMLCGGLCASQHTEECNCNTVAEVWRILTVTVHFRGLCGYFVTLPQVLWLQVYNKMWSSYYHWYFERDVEVAYL